MLLSAAERLRDALIPFLIYGAALLAVLFTILIAQRLIRTAVGARRRALARRYQPAVDAALSGGDGAAAIPRRHRGIAAELLLARLRLLRGDAPHHGAALAGHLGLTGRWRADLSGRRWWRRAEAALALGLIRDRESVRALMRRLDDEHEQVRAAAIDALGQIRDTLSVPALLARIGDPARHEHARVVQALRAYGEWAVDSLIDHGKRHPRDRATVAGILSFIGGTGAAETLLAWTAEPDPALQAAAWSALARIGVDDRGFYHAVKALSARAPAVRSAAARALARTGRADAAPYLAARLDDEWEVAAQSARALARLGAHGTAALQSRVAAGPGTGHDLARQVLWEGGHR